MMRKLIFFLLFSLSLHALQLKDRSGDLKKSAKEFLELFDIPSDLPINQLVSLLKEQWWQVNKERWEMQQQFEVEEKKDQAFPLLKDLGCIETIKAQKMHYNYALVLGAVGKTMQRRLDFLYEEWKRGVRFDQIVLLTGQRDLNPELESYEKGLKSETDLFVYLFNHHPLKNTAPVIVIDSPKEKLLNGNLRRPNTASTIRDWVATQPKPGSCLTVSTQPFIGYQEAIVKFLLSNQFEIEAVGPGTENVYPSANLDLEKTDVPYPMSIYLDNFAKWLMYEHLRDVL